MNIIAKTKITETFCIDCENKDEYEEAICGLELHFGEVTIIELNPKPNSFARLKVSTDMTEKFSYDNIFSIGLCGKPTR